MQVSAFPLMYTFPVTFVTPWRPLKSVNLGLSRITTSPLMKVSWVVPENDFMNELERIWREESVRSPVKPVTEVRLGLLEKERPRREVSAEKPETTVRFWPLKYKSESKTASFWNPETKRTSEPKVGGLARLVKELNPVMFWIPPVSIKLPDRLCKALNPLTASRLGLFSMFRSPLSTERVPNKGISLKEGLEEKEIPEKEYASFSNPEILVRFGFEEKVIWSPIAESAPNALTVCKAGF